MKTQKKTAGRWLLELLSLLFAIVLLSTLTVMGFIAAMGCGWSGSCSKYGFEVLVLMALLVLATSIWFIVKLCKFLLGSQLSSHPEGDNDDSTPQQK